MTIREVQILEPYRAELVESELPDHLEPGEVLIRTEYSGVSSGTELAVYTGIHQWLRDPNYPNWRFPFRAGYSSCGVVEAVGDGVTTLSIGTRVSFAGNHASHVVRRAAGCWVVPEGVDPAIAAFGCIARYGWGAAARVGTTMGRSVFVLGLGVIGQFALRSFLAAGAYPVIGLDPLANRRETALAGGATAALDPTAEDFDAAVATYLDGASRADIVADATGIPTAVPRAMSLTKDGGQCVVVGSPRGLVDGVNFYPDLHKRCIEVLGAHGDFLSWPLGERLGWNVDKAMDWLLNQMATGRLDTTGLPTKRVPPHEAGATYDALLNQKETIVAAAFDWTQP